MENTVALESAKGRPQLRKTTIGYSKKKLRKVFTGSGHLGGSARKSKQVYKKHRLPTSVAFFCTFSRGKRQK